MNALDALGQIAATPDAASIFSGSLAAPVAASAEPGNLNSLIGMLRELMEPLEDVPLEDSPANVLDFEAPGDMAYHVDLPHRAGESASTAGINSAGSHRRIHAPLPVAVPPQRIAQAIVSHMLGRRLPETLATQPARAIPDPAAPQPTHNVPGDVAPQPTRVLEPTPTMPGPMAAPELDAAALPAPLAHQVLAVPQQHAVAAAPTVETSDRDSRPPVHMDVPPMRQSMPVVQPLATPKSITAPEPLRVAIAVKDVAVEQAVVEQAVVEQAAVEVVAVEEVEIADTLETPTSLPAPMQTGLPAERVLVTSMEVPPVEPAVEPVVPPPAFSFASPQRPQAEAVTRDPLAAPIRILTPDAPPTPKAPLAFGLRLTPQQGLAGNEVETSQSAPPPEAATFAETRSRVDAAPEPESALNRAGAAPPEATLHPKAPSIEIDSKSPDARPTAKEAPVPPAASAPATSAQTTWGRQTAPQPEIHTVEPAPETEEKAATPRVRVASAKNAEGKIETPRDTPRLQGVQKQNAADTNAERDPEQEPDSEHPEPIVNTPRVQRERPVETASPRPHATPEPAPSYSTPSMPAPRPRNLEAAPRVGADVIGALRASDSIALSRPAPTVPSTPAQEIAVRVSRPDASPIDVSVRQRGGEIQVAVRTVDTGLQTNLRSELNTLVDSLEKSGYRAETVIPRETASQPRTVTFSGIEASPLGAHPMSPMSGQPGSQQHRGGESGEQPGSRQQQQNQQQQQQNQQQRRAPWTLWQQTLEQTR